VPNLPARGLARWFPAGWVRRASIVLALILVVTIGGVGALWFVSSLTIDQRIAAIGAVLTFAGLAVAVLAAVLALLAYFLADRRASLSVGWAYAANTNGTYTVHPLLMNNGEASAASARVTLTFHHLTVMSSGAWRQRASWSLSWDAVDVHVGEYPTDLPVIVVLPDVGTNDHTISWNVAADRVNRSGTLKLDTSLLREPNA